MRNVLAFIRKGNRRRSLGLITIGLVMLIASHLAESVPDWRTREAVQIVLILGGVVATAWLFRAKDDSHHD